MTTNERLFVAGLTDEWYAAIRARDRAKLIDILRKVEVPGPETIARNVLVKSVIRF